MTNKIKIKSACREKAFILYVKQLYFSDHSYPKTGKYNNGVNILSKELFPCYRTDAIDACQLLQWTWLELKYFHTLFYEFSKNNWVRSTISKQNEGELNKNWKKTSLVVIEFFKFLLQTKAKDHLLPNLSRSLSNISINLLQKTQTKTDDQDSLHLKKKIKTTIIHHNFLKNSDVKAIYWPTKQLIWRRKVA